MCIEEHVITQNWTFRETMTTAGIDVLWVQPIKLIHVKLFPLIASGPQKPQKLTA